MPSAQDANPMAPIRIAIIGLSASAKVSWARTAHLPYFLSPRGRSKYQIVALCNSSVDAARHAIEIFNLPHETRAYGDACSLAQDPDIDLVVCCTRVDVHYATILPSVRAGKHVFVEWPLAHDVPHAQELVDAVKATGKVSLVGLQGRLAPPIVKMRELLVDGRIGKVLSSEIKAAESALDRESLPSTLSYFAERSIGGNFFTIGFGHLFDQAQSVLGEILSPETHCQIQWPEVKLVDMPSGRVVESKRSDVPDLIIATGFLARSNIAQQSATVLIRLRKGQAFKGEPGLVWTIYGQKGEIRLTAHGGPSLHIAAYMSPVTIEVYEFLSDVVEKVEWDWQDWQQDLPIPARSVALQYDKFAEGVRCAEVLPTFESALTRHKQLEACYRRRGTDKME